jgi:hypothetical protein
MTEKEWAVLEEYVRECADMMGLTDWDIQIPRDETPDDDPNGIAVAQTHCVFGQRRATITFHPTFRDKEPDEQRNAVIHELLHIHWWPGWDFVWYLTHHADLVTSAEGNRLWAVYKQHSEYSINGVSEAWACDFEYIEWPKESK